MKPSETELGRRWIQGFSDNDRVTAALLIDSIEIHDHSEILSKIRHRLEALAETNETPIVLVPIRSIEDLPDLGDTESEQIAYKSFNPGSSFPALPGSEADIGGLSRGLITANPEKFISPEVSIDTLRELKARTICLITDYSGSGKQAKSFAQTFKSNSTIASWISYGLIKLHVLSYASSLGALKILSSERHVEFESMDFAKSAESAGWSEEENDRIQKLCVDYSYTDDPNAPLGYKNSFGLYMTNLRVPNNLPQILIRQTGPHPGLFAGREVPHSFFRDLPHYRPAPSLVRTLRNLGADDLASQIEDGTRPVRGLRALAALYLIEYGMSESQVYPMLGLDPEGAEKLKTTLIALECINLDSRLTKRGKDELRRAERKRVTKPKYKHISRPPVSYEPTQLR